MLASQAPPCVMHMNLVGRSGPHTPFRSLTSLQGWHTARVLHNGPKQQVRVCSRRGRNSFFDEDAFQNGKDSFDDAKRLYAEGERMFRGGQFKQGQAFFQQAEQQLRQARDEMPGPTFRGFRNQNWQFPKIEVGKAKPSWSKTLLAVVGYGTLATLVAGPIIATFLAFSVAFGALALTSVLWILPVAGLLLGFGGLLVFPLALTLGLTAAGLGIGALAVALFRGIIPKQTVATYPAAAKAVAQEPVAESEEQRQQRLYEEESEKLASELRDFDAQMEAKEKDAYRQKLKKEGLWRE